MVRRSGRLAIGCSALVLGLATWPVRADIYQWEWISGKGAFQSSTLCPDGAGRSAGPQASLVSLDLTKAYLVGVDLTGANLSNAVLVNARLSDATLTGADLSDAQIGGADFAGTKGFALAQLYSTASYKARDLHGINFWRQDLSNGNLVGQNLSNAYLDSVNLTNADLTDAQIAGASFSQTKGFTVAQIYSTASYKARDLHGIILDTIDLTGINLAGQNLAGAWFFSANLSNADLTNAGFNGAYFSNQNLTNAKLTNANLTKAYFYNSIVTNADFTDAQVRGAEFGSVLGLTVAQLCSTASYRARDLHDIGLAGKDLTGINLADQNLKGARFSRGNLTNADLTDAQIAGASFSGAKGFTLAQLYSTASYKARDLQKVGLGSIDLTGVDFAGQNLTGASFSEANLTNADLADAQIAGGNFIGATGFTLAQLYSTASYKVRDLHGIRLAGYDLTGVDFAGQNLTGARFGEANLTNVDLTNAQIAGAWFDRAKGFTLAQLFSTASYKAHDLHGINLSDRDLTGVDFGGQNLASALFQLSNLTNANLASANLTHAQLILARLTGANLSNADLRGSDVAAVQLASTTAINTIRPDGTIEGLDLGPAQRLSIHDYQPRVGEADIRVKIVKSAAFGPGGTLQIVLDDASWASTIGFEAGIAVSLGGRLELVLGPNVSPTDLLNQPIQLFDWTGVTPSGRFDLEGVSEVKYLDHLYTLTWDTSGLYTDGWVALVAVPEPTPMLGLAVGVVALFRRRRVGGVGVGRG